MFCTNCGAHIEDGAKFCVNCGTPVVANDSAAKEEVKEDVKETIENETVETVETVEENNEENMFKEASVYTYYAEDEVPAAPAEKKIWQIFAKVGFALGLVSFICAFIPFVNYVGIELAIPGLVLSILGKKSNLLRSKAKAGVTFSILGLVLGFVFVVIYACVLSLGVTDAIMSSISNI